MSRTHLVAIVGGSGSGKSCLADQLQQALGSSAGRISLDDFYRDRSHLPPGRRARLNFDHPRAIDWPKFERVLQTLRRGKQTLVPVYDFATHCSAHQYRSIGPCQVLLVDGLWLLHRASLRKLFDLSVYLKCSSALRLRRRLARDVSVRGRSRESVVRQFRSTVEPMHRVHVEPQMRLAHLVMGGTFGKDGVARLVRAIRDLIPAESD